MYLRVTHTSSRYFAYWLQRIQIRLKPDVFQHELHTGTHTSQRCKVSQMQIKMNKVNRFPEQMF